jgi:hypothetical protein
MTELSEDTSARPATLGTMVAKKRKPCPDRAELHRVFASLVALPRRPAPKGDLGAHIDHWGVRTQLEAFVGAIETAHAVIALPIQGDRAAKVRDAEERIDVRLRSLIIYRLVCSIETAVKDAASGLPMAVVVPRFRIVLRMADSQVGTGAALSSLSDSFLQKQIERLLNAPAKGRRTGAPISAARIAAALCVASDTPLGRNYASEGKRVRAFEEIVARIRGRRQSAHTKNV